MLNGNVGSSSIIPDIFMSPKHRGLYKFIYRGPKNFGQTVILKLIQRFSSADFKSWQVTVYTYF